MNSFRRVKLEFLRVAAGFKQAVERPWKMILLFILLGLFAPVYDFIGTMELPDIALPPEVLALFHPAMRILAAAVLLFLFAQTFKFIGGSFWASRDERRVMKVLMSGNNLNSECNIPLLISKYRIGKSPATRREFYSPDVSKEKWVSKEPELMDALDCTLVDSIKYGGKGNNNRHRIVLVTTKGANTPTQGELTDDIS